MRSLRRAFWSTWPRRITGTGFPESRLRRETLFKDSAEISTSAAIRVNTGMRPWARGIFRSCMGTAATADTRMVMTSSAGCISPTWRLPMSRTARMMHRYRIRVRKKGTSMERPPYRILDGGRAEWFGQVRRVPFSFLSFLISGEICRKTGREARPLSARKEAFRRGPLTGCREICIIASDAYRAICIGRHLTEGKETDLPAGTDPSPDGFPQ